jgi:hypothetical protein
VSAIANVVGTLVAGLIGGMICYFLYRKGKKAGAAEVEVKAEERRHAAAEQVAEVKKEVEQDVHSASDEHIIAIATRWMRPSQTSGIKPD